jgi:tripartite-type tricarboxylate transporter receptor subunit TctC
MTDRREFLLSSAAMAASALAPGLAQAATFPARPIKYICPWPAGGSSDVVMRSLAESVGKTLGGTVIVENKPGAAGVLGGAELVNAQPDGYTLAQLPVSVFRVPHMQKTTFNTLKDFTWIICLTGYTFGLVVPIDSPIKSIKDLVAWAKANPNKFTYGTPGTGSSPHLAIEEFAQRAGIELSHIPFKGSSPNLQAVMGGHTMAMSDSTGWGQLVDAGKLRLLATYGSKRTTRWPTVATLNELGYDTVSDSPYGVCGPKNMDPAIVKILHDAFKKTLTDPSVLSVFAQFDQPIIEMNTEQYTKYANETFVAERKTIERLGLLNKD